MTDNAINMDPKWPDDASYEHMSGEVLTVRQVRWFLRELDAGAVVLAAARAQTRAYLERTEKAERERDEFAEWVKTLREVRAQLWLERDEALEALRRARAIYVQKADDRAIDEMVEVISAILAKQESKP